MTLFDHCKKAEIPAEKCRPAIRCTVDSASSDGLLLALPRKYKYSHKTPVTVVFFDPLMGLVRCSCRLYAPVRQGDVRIYHCEVLKTLSTQERRRELKIPLSVAVELEFNDRLWPGTIGNISAGGVMLMSALTVHKGDVIRFQFNEAGEPIPLAAEVLRVELRPAQDGRLTYSYGCRFMDMEPEQVSLLRNYVIREEQRMYFSNS